MDEAVVSAEDSCDPEAAQLAVMVQAESENPA